MEHVNEEWRPIIITKKGILYDFTGLYEISNYGRIRQLNYNNTGKSEVLNLKPDNYGYIIAYLKKDGKGQGFRVHRIVAEAFIPNPNNYPIINHKNEIKDDNRVENLEWCTYKYNINYGTRSKRQSETVRNKTKRGENPVARKVICLETKRVFNSVKEADIWCGAGGIPGCCKDQTRTAGGYHWMYYEDWLKLQEI